MVVEEGGDLVEFCLEGFPGGCDQPQVVGVCQGVEVLAVTELDVRRVVVQPAEQGIHPGDEFQGAEETSLTHPRLFDEGVGEAVCGDDRGKGPGIDVAHEGHRPIGDVEAAEGALNRPVRDSAEGCFEVEVGDVGGEAGAVAFLVERGHEKQSLLCAHPSQEAVLHRVDRGLCVPGVVNRVVEMHREEFERRLQKRYGPQVGERGTFVGILEQGVDPAPLPSRRDHPVLQGKVHHVPDDLLEGGAAHGDERVAESRGARGGRERGF